MEEIIEYFNTLEKAYYDGNLFFCNNSDCAHNAAISILMFEKGSHVLMFCGKMSIFHKDFYDKIRKINGEECGNYLQKRMIESWLNFISKNNSKFEIILESNSKSFADNLIFSKNVLDIDKVNIRAIRSSIGNKGSLTHFSFTGDEQIVRIELDKESHQAICKIGNDPRVDSPAPNFKRLIELSDPVAIDR